MQKESIIISCVQRVHKRKFVFWAVERFDMILFLKIAVLFFCTAVLLIISCHSEHKKGTCMLLSFFVSAGVTTFFSEDAILLSILCALGVFLVLSVMTFILSHVSLHRKHREEGRKSF